VPVPCWSVVLQKTNSELGLWIYPRTVFGMWKTGCSYFETVECNLKNCKQQSTGNRRWLRFCGNSLDTNLKHRISQKRQYLKDRFNDLEWNSKNKNIRDLYRGITEFKKGYQPRTNLVKDKRGDLLADSHKLLTRQKNYFCQILKMYKGWVVLGRRKYRQQSYLCQCLWGWGCCWQVETV
jgi:hypothetical protein